VESILVKDIAIIMMVAGATLLLFRRLHLPPILGYLVAGIIIGPYSFPFPSIDDVETIRHLSDLGLVILLFALGLEFGWERIRQVGVNVVFIGVVEIAFMMVLGYQAGLLLGWNGEEALFLGACISISSSAVLVKTLRDNGKLGADFARLMVGILVVEDFAAVIMLTVLSGAAGMGGTSWSNVGFLAGKLALFTVAALTLGTLLAPRLINAVANFRSIEMLLIISLALCFGLALIAQELGLSAAAGAFLIGTVLGDTKQSKDISEMMIPVRDMFGALFFVAVGMLIDVRLIGQFLLPVLVVSVVFVAGKIIANTIATFLTGHDFRTSVRVGMGMPQIGEFSLAIVKVGAERAALGGFFYPILTAATGVISLVYPITFRYSDAAAHFLERHTPRMVHLYVAGLERWLALLRASFVQRGPIAQQVSRATRIILLNVAIIMVLVAIGTFILGYRAPLSRYLPLSDSEFGLIVGFGVLILCAPSGLAIWRELQDLAEKLTLQLFQRRAASMGRWKQEEVRQLLRDSILAALVLLLAVWAVPFLSHLLSLGRLSVPLPLLLLGGAVFITGRIALRIQRILVTTFSRTFLGGRDGVTEEKQKASDAPPEEGKGKK